MLRLRLHGRNLAISNMGWPLVCFGTANCRTIFNCWQSLFGKKIKLKEIAKYHLKI